MIDTLTFTAKDDESMSPNDRIELLESILSSIVLCRQCVNYDEDFNLCLHQIDGNVYRKPMPPDGYCSYGKHE